MAKGVVIAAPASGSGKTIVTLGLLRALRNRGIRVASAKIGPDYIDPCFHEAATGRPCFNLDPWAMSPPRIATYLEVLSRDCDVVIVEGVMGLFDGPLDCEASTHDAAAALGLPIVLVVDCSHMAQSVGSLVQGFEVTAKRRLPVIFNRVASEKHEAVLRHGLKMRGAPILGAVHRDEALQLPSRHLGLVQAAEHAALDGFLDHAAQVMARSIDIGELIDLCLKPESFANGIKPFPPLGQTVAVASDQAFAFAYPHMLSDWRAQGVDIVPFSPLADEAPSPTADAIFLPGGYPELHAGKLASNAAFLAGLQTAAASGKLIYGECGGFMVLGDYIIDAEGRRHMMAGLLPLGTSFAKRKLHLGYRTLAPLCQAPWPTAMTGHEFHYSTVDWQGDADPLFAASDASNATLGNMGFRRGTVMGSYAHVIAPESE